MKNLKYLALASIFSTGFAFAQSGQTQSGQGQSSGSRQPVTGSSSSNQEQSGMQSSGQPSGSSTAAEQGQSAMQSGGQQVPQYTIQNIEMYIGQAEVAAKALQKEKSQNIPSQQLQVQSQELVQKIQQARQNLQQLNQNAVKTNPEVVGQIQKTLGQLDAALVQAHQLDQSAQKGNVGPAYSVASKSALSHLNQATDLLPKIAKSYEGGGSAQKSGGSSGK